MHISESPRPVQMPTSSMKGPAATTQQLLVKTQQDVKAGIAKNLGDDLKNLGDTIRKLFDDAADQMNNEHNNKNDLATLGKRMTQAAKLISNAFGGN